MTPLDWIFFVGGFVLLIGGAEMLIRGASRLASSVGITPLVIGLTVVAFGTSAPELAINVRSAFVGQSDLAIGNVIGSNIFNVLFILGLSALVTPLIVQKQLIRLDVPIMIVVSIVAFLMALDGSIGKGDGILLVAALVLYIAWSIRLGRSDTAAVQVTREAEHRPRSALYTVSIQLVLIVGGLGFLVAGSQLLVEGAVAVARLFGVSELIIGLTIVAAGTSLPEVATSVLAALRGERDLAVGNVVGSNIFNLLAVLGVSAFVAPDGVAVSRAAIAFDLPVMLVVALACLPIFLHENRINRWEGALFLAYYVAYTIYLVLDATGHDLLAPFSRIMLEFALPLTGVTLVIVFVRYWRRGQTETLGDSTWSNGD
jgi:cation:H+ antiporter